MKLSDIKTLNEGWTALQQDLDTCAEYTLDLVQNFISKQEVEIYAQIFTKAHKKVKEQKIYIGPDNMVNQKELEELAKKFFDKFCKAQGKR